MSTVPTSISIAVDAMGSDMGPTEVVAGVAIALKNGWVHEKLVLVGQEEVLPADRPGGRVGAVAGVDGPGGETVPAVRVSHHRRA